MEFKHCLTRTLWQARRDYVQLYWFQWVKKSNLAGEIRALKDLLKEFKNV